MNMDGFRMENGKLKYANEGSHGGTSPDKRGFTRIDEVFPSRKKRAYDQSFPKANAKERVRLKHPAIEPECGDETDSSERKVKKRGIISPLLPKFNSITNSNTFQKNPTRNAATKMVSSNLGSRKVNGESDVWNEIMYSDLQVNGVENGMKHENYLRPFSNKRIQKQLLLPIQPSEPSSPNLRNDPKFVENTFHKNRGIAVQTSHFDKEKDGEIRDNPTLTRCNSSKYVHHPSMMVKQTKNQLKNLNQSYNHISLNLEDSQDTTAPPNVQNTSNPISNQALNQNLLPSPSSSCLCPPLRSQGKNLIRTSNQHSDTKAQNQKQVIDFYHVKSLTTYRDKENSNQFPVDDVKNSKNIIQSSCNGSNDSDSPDLSQTTKDFFSIFCSQDLNTALIDKGDNQQPIVDSFSNQSYDASERPQVTGKAKSHENPTFYFKHSSISPDDKFWNEAFDECMEDMKEHEMKNKVCISQNDLEAIHDLNKNYDSNDERTMMFDICKENQLVEEQLSIRHDSNVNIGEQAKNLPCKSTSYLSSPFPIKRIDFSSGDVSPEKSKCCLESKNQNRDDTFVPESLNCHSTFTTQSLEILTNNIAPSPDPPQLDSHSPLALQNANLFNPLRVQTAPCESAFINGGTPGTNNLSMGVREHEMELSYWLPPVLCEVYARKGITRLFNWQVECLKSDGVIAGKNLVFCASTSAGKSLVSEILLLRRIYFLGQKCILVLPYVALCAQKFEHMQHLLSALGKKVSPLYGSLGNHGFSRNSLLAVCTIEKANSLLNRFLEEGKLSEISTIVIDELHMIGEKERGYLLELMLTKLRYSIGAGEKNMSPKQKSSETLSKTKSKKSSSTDSLQTNTEGITNTPSPNQHSIEKFVEKEELQSSEEKLFQMFGREETKSSDSERTKCFLRNEAIKRSGSERTKSLESSEKNDFHDNLQIIGMSATMPNAKAIANWLNASLYCTDFRPVPLEEYIKIGDVIYDSNLTEVRKLNPELNLEQNDMDHLIELSHEVVKDGYSVLIFCPTRKGCESTATHVAQYLPQFQQFKSQDSSDKPFDLDATLEDLKRSSSGLDPVLEKAIPNGVAFHHAGLTNDERELVEECFKNGIIRVLAATSTLAAGINLPARRVIFRQPYIGQEFIDSTRYRQMAGRAGRTGIDIKGESIVICNLKDAQKMANVMAEKSKTIESCLLEGIRPMTRALLEAIASGIVNSSIDVHRFIHCTLLSSTRPFSEVGKSVTEALKWLCRNKLIEWNDETSIYIPTQTGKATFAGSLTPEEALHVFRDLETARKGLVLASDLHLIYQVTPVYIDFKPDWSTFHAHFSKLDAIEKAVANNIGVDEHFLLRMVNGGPLPRFNSQKNMNCKDEIENQDRANKDKVSVTEERFRITKRFFVALLLSKLIHEVPINELCKQYRVSKAMLQSLQENSAKFTSMVCAFCQKMGWNDLEGLFTSFVKRIVFGVRAEIVELTSIPYVKASRARALYKSGLRTVQSVAEASISEITKALTAHMTLIEDENNKGVGMKKIQSIIAAKIRNGARKLMEEKAEEEKENAIVALKALGINVPNEALDKPLLTFDELEKGDLIPEHTNQDASKKNVSSINDKNTSPLKSSEKENLNNVEFFDFFEKNSPIFRPIDVDQNFHGGFTVFYKLFCGVNEFFFDFHIETIGKKSNFSTKIFEVCGVSVCWKNSPIYYINLNHPKIPKSKSDGLNRGKNLPPKFESWKKAVEERWKLISKIFQKKDVKKIGWDLKNQIKILTKPMVKMEEKDKRFDFWNSSKDQDDKKKYQENELNNKGGCCISLEGFEISDIIVDMKICSWILSPDELSSNPLYLEQLAKQNVSNEFLTRIQREWNWKYQTSAIAKNGVCKRLSCIRVLFYCLWKRLFPENLYRPFQFLEMPMVRVLADMETNGIQIDVVNLEINRNLIQNLLSELEKKAYTLANCEFSLTNSADVSEILFKKLNLTPPANSKKSKLHISTSKSVLSSIKEKHPLVSIILEHRSLSKLLTGTILPLKQFAVISPPDSNASYVSESFESPWSEVTSEDSYLIFGRWLQTSTATGRLSMESPNLQCMQKEIVVELGEDEDGEYYFSENFAIENDSRNADKNVNKTGNTEINLIGVKVREAIVPSRDGWLLLTADYSQIEVRIMAHFSKDQALVKILQDEDGDVFCHIASKWTGVSPSNITRHSRDLTKRLVYGILYGMGSEALSEALSCDEATALDYRNKILDAFPGLNLWMESCVNDCRSKGYIETIFGRRRYLTGINSKNSKEKSKSERQAINSICQGSAADIIKKAMIDFYFCVKKDPKFSLLGQKCHLLLQIHDELVIEVDRQHLDEVGSLVKSCMQHAVQLDVPLVAKLKVGKSWGSVMPYSL